MMSMVGVTVLCGWEGNRRSAAAPVMHDHSLRGMSIYGLNGLRREERNPPILLQEAWHPLQWTLIGSA